MVQYSITSTKPNEVSYVSSLPMMHIFSIPAPQAGKEAEWLDRFRAALAQQIPSTLVAAGLEVGKRFLAGFSDNALLMPQDEVSQGLDADSWRPCDTSTFNSAAGRAFPALEVLWQHHFRDTPAQILVHLTQHGKGGSYHTSGGHTLTIGKSYSAISVRPDRRQHEDPAGILAHETIHLAINKSVEDKYARPGNGFQVYQIKEAIVDRILESDQFKTVLGPIEAREVFRPHLPADWQTLAAIIQPFTWQGQAA